MSGTSRSRNSIFVGNSDGFTLSFDAMSRGMTSSMDESRVRFSSIDGTLAEIC